MKKFAIGALVVVIFAAVVGGFLLLGGGGGGGGENNRPVAFVVESGWNAGRIAEELEKSKVINSANLFRAYMRLRGVGQDLKSGQYDLKQEMPFSEVADALQAGPKVTFAKLTIPEGLTLEQTAERIGQKTHIKTDAFKSAATPSTKKPGIVQTDVANLEGFLYPETYFVTEKESPADVVTRLVDQFEKATAGVDWQKSSQFDLTSYQILVIASMIEEEAKVEDEREKISAVIHNRLKRRMKLEIDATVQYAVKKYSGEPLTQEDIDVNSPYNTRRFAGLPPGPIASPRVSSISAALNPAATDHLFYVLSPDCKRHVFTADFDEFTRAKQQLPSC
jgi:UPF0755 protein